MAVLHTEDEILLGFEAQVELSDKGVATAFLKDFSLILNNILLLILDYELLVDDFHGHQLSISSCEVDFGESSCS
jgi:hypothetical protein